MKAAIIFCFLAACVLCLPGIALAKPYFSQTGLKRSLDKSDVTETGGASNKKDARYENAMRDLDREYQAGGLTKTEYIQRKRELDNLEF